MSIFIFNVCLIWDVRAITTKRGRISLLKQLFFVFFSSKCVCIFGDLKKNEIWDILHFRYKGKSSNFPLSLVNLWHGTFKDTYRRDRGLIRHIMLQGYIVHWIMGQPIKEIKYITEFVFFPFTGASVVNDTSSLSFAVFTRDSESMNLIIYEYICYDWFMNIWIHPPRLCHIL